MAKAFMTLAGLMLGAMLGGVVTFFGGIWAGEMFRVSQAEGAYAMQVAFFFTPIGMIAGAIAGVIAARAWCR